MALAHTKPLESIGRNIAQYEVKSYRIKKYIQKQSINFVGVQLASYCVFVRYESRNSLFI